VAAARPPVKETTMRTRMVALVLTVALGSAGCGRGAADDPAVATAQDGAARPSGTPSAPASADPDAPLKFSRCMRAQGLTWFPDPAGGKMNVTVPKGVNPQTVEAAQGKCKQYLPGGDEAPKLSAEDLEAMRQMARCMRANGIPNFPDPQPNGSLMIDTRKIGAGPDDPVWKKADAICAKHRPKGAVQGRRDSGGGAVGGQKAAE
jgi:hypothetical protein